MNTKIHINIKLLTWFNFFSDFRLYAPVAIIYFTKISGSYALGLGIFSIEMISSSIFELPTGLLSDYVGRKKTVILGAITGLITVVLYAVGLNFWILALGSIFAGLSRSFYSGNNSALLHDSLRESHQEKEYAKYSGKTDSMFQIALAISALLGSIIAFWSFPLVMWLSVIPQFICLLLSLKLINPKLSDNKSEVAIFIHLKESISNILNNRKLKMISIATILDHGIGETIYQFQSAFIATLWPVWAIGFSKMIANLCAAFGMRISDKLSKKYGHFKTLFFSSIYNRIAGIFAAAIPTPISPILMASTSMTSGIGWISQDAISQENFTNKQRATMGSITSLVSSLFFGVFAFGFGYLADRLYPSTALIVGEVLTISVLAIYWSIFKNRLNLKHLK